MKIKNENKTIIFFLFFLGLNRVLVFWKICEKGYQKKMNEKAKQV